MVLVARWFLTLCPISSQFGKPAYLGRLKDRARLQMVVEMDISETTLRSADIPSRVFHGVQIAFSRFLRRNWPPEAKQILAADHSRICGQRRRALEPCLAAGRFVARLS